MAFIIHYEDSDIFKPYKDDNFCYQGVFFRDNCEVSLQDSLNITDINLVQALRSFLCTINGFFNFVIHTGNKVYVATDRVRSVPLFYSNTKTDFYISNDANWLKNKIQASEVDSISKEEFLLTGYVTGSDTLFSEIKQVQAGELLVIEEMNGMYSIACEDYYIFSPKYDGIIDEGKTSYFNKLDKISVNIVKRLITFANDKQIVIPLSAGRDSRLIVLILKKLGYENVVCFSYGKIDNFESRESKIIAEKLGYKWYFVEYLPDLEKIIYGTEEGFQFQKYSGNLTSMPCFQDLIAIKVLKEKKLIEEDAVLCPGHTGDFVAGGHIPQDANHRKSNTRNLLDNIVFGHYVLFNIYKLNKKIRKKIFSKILSTFKSTSIIKTGVDMSTYFETWDWRERQSKYIINSLRVYEFYGYQWWIPLWDKEFIEFWTTVPFIYRKGKKLYNEYVDNLSLNMIDYMTFSNNASVHSMRKKIVFLLDCLKLKEIIKKLFVYCSKSDISQQLAMHPNVSAELYNDVIDINELKNLKSFIGINAYLYLNKVEHGKI